MAAKIVTALTNLLIIQECKIYIEITELNSQNLRIIQTPGFFPLPNTSVEFRFEAFYQSIKVPNVEDNEYDLFKLTLIKLPDSGIPLSLKMDVNITIRYSDWSVFQKYKPLFSINVWNMDNIRFEDVFSPLRWWIFNSGHYNKMLSKKLIFECYFKFYDDDTPLALLYDREILSLFNLRKFNQELSRFYKAYIKYDTVFKVGERYLYAHRSILNAHSPVFRKIVPNTYFLTSAIGVSYETLYCFLKYFYLGEIECKFWHIIKDLYALASKYEVQTLKRECAYLIASFLSFDQVCEILKLAYVYGDEELKQISKQFAATHYRELQSTNDWKELIISNPNIGYEIMEDFILKSNCESNQHLLEKDASQPFSDVTKWKPNFPK